ncbi:hypothetical protein [Deefgea piscis]|uniref:hypothetical protein n=1 Tax=Deefgea piscis TaxID=2739061 RepID=UPI001C80527A|nr:hypothetical protein [Deefgea piscis]QZA79671.1 hypothetical protein K4H25_08845 [Deefgea piscis]
MSIVISVFCFLIFFAAATYLFRFLPWTKQDWKALPTKDEYIALHGCQEEATCFKCGSTHVFDFGGLNPGMTNRKVMCTKCKTALWRETF